MYVGRDDAAQEFRIIIATVDKVFRMIVANADVIDQHTHIQTFSLFAYLIIDLRTPSEVHIDYTHLNAKLAACKYATKIAGLSRAYTRSNHAILPISSATAFSLSSERLISTSFNPLRASYTKKTVVMRYMNIYTI